MRADFASQLSFKINNYHRMKLRVFEKSTVFNRKIHHLTSIYADIPGGKFTFKNCR